MRAAQLGGALIKSGQQQSSVSKLVKVFVVNRQLSKLDLFIVVLLFHYLERCCQLLTHFAGCSTSLFFFHSQKSPEEVHMCLEPGVHGGGGG